MIWDTIINTASSVGSFLTSTSVGWMIIGAVIFGLFIGFVFRSFKRKVAQLAGDYFTKTSLIVIAAFDIAATLDPTQTVLGIALAPIAGVTVFIIEMLYDGITLERHIFKNLAAAIVAMFVIMVPTPMAGIIVAWYGAEGGKFRKFLKRG